MITRASRAIAAVGVVLAFVSIWTDSFPGSSYWSGDGTVGAFCLLLACLSALALVTGYARSSANEPLLAAGAVMLGFYVFPPAAVAFDGWDQLQAGAWLGVAAGGLVVIGAAASAFGGALRSTPGGFSPGALMAGVGIALVFPGVFVDASGGISYWAAGDHVLGVVLLVAAIGAALAVLATVAGVRTHGLDQTLTLVVLGLTAFYPVGAAWGDFGNLDSGSWLAFAGGILAAGGVWAARGLDALRAAPASA